MLKRTIPLTAAIALFAMSPGAAHAGSVVQNNLANCRAGASGAHVLVRINGFRQGTGRVRVQSYRGDSWLESGQWLHRVDIPVRLSGRGMAVCLPLPSPGAYGIAVRHDENNNGESDRRDGGGFSRNPDISFPFGMRPRFNRVAINAGSGVTPINVVLNYLQGSSVEPIG